MLYLVEHNVRPLAHLCVFFILLCWHNYSNNYSQTLLHCTTTKKQRIKQIPIVMSGNSINQNPMPQSSLSAAAGKADDDNHSDNNSCNSRTSCNSNSNNNERNPRDAEPETADLHHLMKSLQQEQDKQNHHHPRLLKVCS